MIWIHILGGVSENIAPVAAPSVFIEAPKGMPYAVVRHKPNLVTGILEFRCHVHIFKNTVWLIQIAVYGKQRTASVSAVAAIDIVAFGKKPPDALRLIYFFKNR